MQGALPKPVPKVTVRSLLHQQPHYLYVPPLHRQMEGSLLVDVLDIRTGPLGEEGGREGGRGGEERERDTLLPNSPAIMRVRLLLDHSLLC